MAADESHDDKTQTHIILTKGTMVSHYQIIEKIGAGGMGEVYLAEDTALKRKVALKFLPSHLCRDNDCRERFKREAQAVAKLNHPNIVTIHEVGENQGRPYFVMEHVAGQSLKGIIKGCDLSLDHIIALIIQICEGLSKAHQSDITHRDIKPSNIVIDADGHPKLLDFGLAAMKDKGHLTKTGSTLGTIGYMSPEQVQGKDFDHRSDLFSLGVVLYEMIAGRLPFTADTEAATMNAVLNESPEPLSRYKSGVSGELQRIVSKSLEKDPSLRYQSADGLISDLRTLTRDESSVADKPRVDWWNRFVVVGAVIVCLIMAVYWLLPMSEKKAPPVQPKNIMLAVLPFENLGNPEDEYFADGITDEITSRLARLTALRVISRTSAIQYKDTDKGLPQIAEELGVDYILEGTIRWDKSTDTDRVRITPQLIRVSDNINLWTDRYNAVIDDIFAIQSSIAESVAEELDITLLESERQALNEQPTENTDAYDYFLRGLEHFGNHSSKGYMNAEAMFQKATELEPDFAFAYGWLSAVHTQIYWLHIDRTEERLAAAKEAVDRALKIAPDRIDVQGALAWYHYAGLEDYDRALEEFIALREKRPSEAIFSFCLALIQRGQGKWEDAVTNFERAIRLDPRSAVQCSEYGLVLLYLHRYDEAEALCNRAIELKPDMVPPHVYKSLIYVHRNGDIMAARQVLQEALQKVDRWPELTHREARLDMIAGDYGRALEFLAVYGNNTNLSARDSAYCYNLKGSVYRYMDQVNLMKSCYDSARVILDRLVLGKPDDPWNHIKLGLALAGLGCKEEAIREGQLAVELLTTSENALDTVRIVKDLSIIYSIVGEYDLAIEQFDYLLSAPSTVSIPFLKIWPDFAPMRDHPRFRALLKKYE
ncbi:MAG: protein kinase [candidate division Zixibacteria bacterium]|nr:protein kinase [candidate division Zixibacteria bacterium]